MDSVACAAYAARVEFDKRSDLFLGRLVGTRDIARFHGETVAELCVEFEEAVEDDVAGCRKIGKTAEKAASGRSMLRVPPPVRRAALVAAGASDKSLNQWATKALKLTAAAATGGRAPSTVPSCNRCTCRPDS